MLFLSLIYISNIIDSGYSNPGSPASKYEVMVTRLLAFYLKLMILLCRQFVKFFNTLSL